jgi:Phasin protein
MLLCSMISSAASVAISHHHTRKTGMAQIAKSETDKHTITANPPADNGELSKQAFDKAADATREAVGQAEDVARGGLQFVQRTVDAAVEVERQTARRAAEGTAEISQMLVDLINEQTRQNIQALTALGDAVDWQRIFQVQRELMQANLERTAEFTRRYVEVSQAVLTSMLSATQDQTRKAT